MYAPGRMWYHARVLEGVAKRQFPRKAVVFKSGDSPQRRSIFVYPLEHSGVVPEVRGAGRPPQLALVGPRGGALLLI